MLHTGVVDATSSSEEDLSGRVSVGLPEYHVTQLFKYPVLGWVEITLYK